MYYEFLDALDELEMGFSDEYLAQILAVTYVYGGSNEEFTKGGRLTAVVKVAQKRFNVEGSNRVYKPELIKKFVKELSEEETPEWLEHIKEEYKIKVR